MSNVKIVKLLNGEMYIGTVSEETDDSISLEKYYQIIVTPKGEIGMMDFNSNISIEAPIKFKDSIVLYQLVPNERFLQAYQTQASNIVVPTAQESAAINMSDLAS